jgi:hypothetical protein
LAKAKVIAEIPKSKADEPEYFINLGHFESKITFYSARKNAIGYACSFYARDQTAFRLALVGTRR